MIRFDSIIFDFGGVILDIDYKLTTEAFRRLGIEHFNQLYTQMKQDRLFDDFETGLISARDFRQRLNSYSPKSLSDAEIDHAWNAILIGLPKENVDLLYHLKEKYRLFLLSNTNEIHEKAFREMITNQFGEFIIEQFFERIYLSHHIHLRKPNLAIFQLVIQENELDPGKTLFIDDSPQHIEGARKAGLQTILLEKRKSIRDLFLEMKGSGFTIE